MLEPFYWMFKTEGFKEQVKYLFFIFFKFYLVAIGLALITANLVHDAIFSTILFIISFLFFVLPLFCIQGYFWCVTENIISREWDITSATVYNGKVKEIFKVKLPELNTGKFIWRGIASCVATLMMILPFTIILTTSAFATTFANIPIQTLLIVYVFLTMFIPALLWNYAARDSVFAVWNIRKAIHIMGNYTGKYIWNTILFALFYILSASILSLIAMQLGVQEGATYTSILSAAKLLICLAITYLQYLYSLYVYAYLLGTIAPPAEG